MQLMQSQLPRWLNLESPKRYPFSKNHHVDEHDISIDLHFQIQHDQNKACKLIAILYN